LLERKKPYALRFDLSIEIIYQIVIGDYALSKRSVTRLERG
jgi:hypothetical protein